MTESSTTGRKGAAEAPRARLLVVDDDGAILSSLTRLLSQAGYEVEGADGVDVATRCLRTSPFDVVVTDLRMPRASGLVLLERAQEIVPDTPVIVLTGHPDARSAVDAVRRGAFDFVSKSAGGKEILATIEGALVATFARARRAAVPPPASLEALGLVGASPQMERVFDLVRAVAANRCSVLIQGESGTGKELVARAIHWLGEARHGPFLVVNCAALPRDLLESQLFGHRKGSFTGAASDYMGMFRAADGGTLFLDEISELPLDLQQKLLRALQEREVLPIGSTTPVKVDVRFLAATNRNLREAVGRALFREDLFFRLDVVQIDLPPLRERPLDLPVLVAHFVTRFAKEYGVEPKRVEPAALARMQAHGWPGNVRELQNVLERAYAIGGGGWLRVEDLPEPIREAAAPAAPEATAEPAGEGAANPGAERPVETLAESERSLLARALLRSGGNKKRAAELLGIPRQRLYRLLERHGLSDSAS